MATYNHNRAKDHRKFKGEMVVITMLLLAGLFVGSWVIADLLLNDSVVVEQENKPVTLGSYSPQDEIPKRLFETETYSLEVPGEWKLLENQLRSIDGVPYRYDSFQGIADDQLGRELEVYVDKIPAAVPVTKIAETIITNDGEIVITKVSPHCRSYTKVAEDSNSNAVISKWNDTAFTCDIIDYKNSTVAVVGDEINGIALEGTAGEHRFLLVYYDHGDRQNSSVFKEVLSSLKAL